MKRPPSLPCREGTWRLVTRRSLTPSRLLMVTLLLASSGCGRSFLAPEASPHLPPLTARMTQERCDQLAESGDLGLIFAEIERRDREIDALVREGTWAETMEERRALRGATW